MRALVALLCLVACAAEDADTGAIPYGDELGGEELYTLACARCHGADARGGDLGPDLVDRAVGLDVDEIAEVVLEGSGYMNPVPLDEAQAYTVAEYVAWTVSR